MQWIKKMYHYLIALLSYIYYGRPSRKLIVIGVTGTKGKSTTCSFISSVLRAGGKKVAVLSTVEFRIGNKRELNTKKMTMLGRGQIHKFLAQAVKEGCEYAVIETSSEGILQYRHKFLNYDVAIFTNLGTEHSERHGGFENLKRDKGKLFKELEKKNKTIKGKKIQKVIIVNGDDKNYLYYSGFKADKKIGYGFKDIKYVEDVEKLRVEGISTENDNLIQFIVNENNYKLNIAGKFNIYNALASIAVGKTFGIGEKDIQKGVEDVKLVEGRMEFVEAGQDFKVVVDFAHEPMSYKELFTSLRDMVSGNQKIISLIGSDGGGRDIGKRKKMGGIAGELCDIVIVTDVNCYDENPIEIAEMLASGARQFKKDDIDLFIEVDRKKAIELAVSKAKTGDIIAITAKGTEPCIAIANGKTIDWDDKTITLEILQRYVDKK